MKSLPTLQVHDTKAQIIDAVLLASIAQGDENALIACYDRYNRVLFGLIVRILYNRAESEDVLQEVFVQVWQQAKNYDEERGKAFSWLATMTHSKTIDRLSYLKIRSQTKEKIKANKPLYIDSKIEDHLIFQMPWKQVRTALSQLPDKERRLLLMAYFEGYSQSEIAQLTEIPLETVKTTMRVGMTKLRETLNVDSAAW